MRWIFPLLLVLPCWPQIQCGATPDSMVVAKAGSLAAQELGRWRVYCRNIGTSDSDFTTEDFAINFIELHILDAADVGDVFSVKQKKTKWAKAAMVAEVVGITALLVIGQQYVKVSTDVATGVGIGAYSATKIGQWLGQQIPPTKNATSGMLSQERVSLHPGDGINWKLYASKIHGATAIGPRILTGTIQTNPR